MPHKCVRCGREYREANPTILAGCHSCGGRKFLYVREEEKNKDILEEKPLEVLVQENAAEVLEVETTERPGGVHREKVESITIVSPGEYELNIEKLAQSDERVVGIGREGNYIVDLLSMVKPGRKKKKKK